MPSIKATIIAMGLDPFDKTKAWINLCIQRPQNSSTQMPQSSPQMLPPQMCECPPITLQMPQFDANSIMRFSLSQGEFNELRPQIGGILVISLSRPEGST